MKPSVSSGYLPGLDDALIHSGIPRMNDASDCHGELREMSVIESVALHPAPRACASSRVSVCFRELAAVACLGGA